MMMRCALIRWQITLIQFIVILNHCSNVHTIYDKSSLDQYSSTYFLDTNNNAISHANQSQQNNHNSDRRSNDRAYFADVKQIKTNELDGNGHLNRGIENESTELIRPKRNSDDLCKRKICNCTASNFITVECHFSAVSVLEEHFVHIFKVFGATFLEII